MAYTEALVNRDMLRWALQRRFGSLSVAEQLNIEAAKLNNWLEGQARPTFRQAQDLARKLRIPLGYLFLSKPPEEVMPLADLRSRSGTSSRSPSPDFLDVLYDALRKQEWYHEYLANEGVDPLPFVGRFNAQDAEREIAADIRDVLQLDEVSQRPGMNVRGAFFREFVSQAESAGIVVLRNSVVGNNTHRQLDPDEFQGFAISDALAPLVFINTRDFRSAQTFTLAHELTHVWMGISAVSGIEYFAKPEEQLHSDEKVTDAVAAEILVPSDSFNLRWNPNTSLDTNLNLLSGFYNVSKFVILRRAYELNRFTSDTFHTKHRELVRNITPRQRSSGGGGFGTIFARNGETVTNAVLYSLLEGRIAPKQASELLNVRVAKLPGLEGYLKERAPSHG